MYTKTKTQKGDRTRYIVVYATHTMWRVVRRRRHCATQIPNYTLPKTLNDLRDKTFNLEIISRQYLPNSLIVNRK